VSKDQRLIFESANRNADPILEVLKPLVGIERCDILEVASGSGQHAVHMTAACPNLTWWPSDFERQHVKSIDAWRETADRDAIRPAALLDVTAERWRSGVAFDDWPALFDGIVNVNMIHIAPWWAAEGLVEGAAVRVKPGGFLYFYGPFKRGGAHTAPSNEAFDASLRQRDSAWGVRDIADVEALAMRAGFGLEAVIPMPANNFSVIFRNHGA